MGKGCRPRPFNITQTEYSNNFDRIFGKKTAPGGEDEPNDAGRDSNSATHADQQLTEKDSEKSQP